MNYSISICYPNKENIEEIRDVHQSEIQNKFQNYPWEEQQKTLESDPENAQYSPSFRITNKRDKHWLELTAMRKKDKTISFSKWFNRLTEKKVLFGLLGTKMKLSVIDDNFEESQSINLEEASELVKLFLNQHYKEVEERI